MYIDVCVCFKGLFAKIGASAVAEKARQSVGLSQSCKSINCLFHHNVCKYLLNILLTLSAEANVLLTKANLDRLVDTLCRVRGAALKFGQMISIQGTVHLYVIISSPPLLTHHSSFTTHHLPLPTHHSPLTTYHSPLLTHCLLYTSDAADE